MILSIVKFGDPVLRKRGARIDKLTPEIEQLIDDMLETMHTAAGVGLAAQQVGRALQVTVLDVSVAKDRPSTLEWKGQPMNPNERMPLVLINPQIKPVGEPVTGPEGCLSFPEMYCDITRPESVEVSALDRNFQPIEFKAGGLLSRAVQHEVDHLNGVLFIDRIDREAKAELQAELDELQQTTKDALKNLKPSVRL